MQDVYNLPEVRQVPIEKISLGLRLRRTPEDSSEVAPHSNIEGLAHSMESMGGRAVSTLVQPPLVADLGDGRYRLLAGARRMKAAISLGWETLPCIVYRRMEPVNAFTLALLENLHHIEPHPLDRALAIRMGFLLTNARAAGYEQETAEILDGAWEQSASGQEVVTELAGMLDRRGWDPDNPLVSWDDYLDSLGLAPTAYERRRFLRLVNIHPELQDRLRQSGVTEPAVRALGTLDAADQRRVVEAVCENPALARKVRRIARTLREGFYEDVDDALAEVRGQVIDVRQLEETAGEGEIATELDVKSGLALGEATGAESVEVGGYQVSQEVQDAVIRLLEQADRCTASMKTVKGHAQGRLDTLPDPWGGYTRDTLRQLAMEIEQSLGSSVV